ncbi:MAG: hypothetical protein AB8H47_29935 [Bacteroidia bacterium]
MQQLIRHTLLFTLLFCGLFSQSFAQSVNQLQIRYLEFLESQEIEGKIDTDGDIQFKHEERSYFIEVDATDTEFFRLVLPNVWPIESEEERLQVLRAVDFVNNQVKVAKTYTVKDNVWIGIEVFRDDIDDYEEYFERSLQVIDRSVDYFIQKMEE